MIGISIQFLTGRYHATPWNRHCNEGIPERFPSPWRVLRSLVAAYHKSSLSLEQTLSILEKLSSELPCYVLPQATEAHTRHFMPLWKEGEFKTTQVLDSFYIYGGGALSPDAKVDLVWRGVELCAEEINLLKHLCSLVGYIGRAESWTELRVMDSYSNEFHAVPSAGAVPPGMATEKMLGSLSPVELEQFKADMAALKLPKSIKQMLPRNTLEALELDVAVMRKQGWSDVPGAKWVQYAITEPAPPKQLATAKAEAPTFARFAVAGAVLPLFRDVVSVSDRVHLSLCKRSDGEAVFTGRDANGEPLKGYPDHARYLPESDIHGRIAYINVVATGGFNPKAVSALANLRILWGKDGYDLSVGLVALGKVEEYRNYYPKLLGHSTVWRSVTPLVLPRFPKKKIDPETGRQKDGLDHQIHKMLQALGFDAPTDIKPTGDRWLKWRVLRQNQYNQRVPSGAYGLELRFAKPQTGVLSLGYNSHYGLGLFTPIQCADG